MLAALAGGNWTRIERIRRIRTGVGAAGVDVTHTIRSRSVLIRDIRLIRVPLPPPHKFSRAFPRAARSPAL